MAVILDAFSRGVIGWAMADHLGANLVHHSDRDAQYARAEYTGELDAHRIAASMSRVGNPYDNAKAERFIRTLKSEEIDGTRYRDHRDAQTTSAPSSARSTTASGCTPRSAIKRPSRRGRAPRPDPRHRPSGRGGFSRDAEIHGDARAHGLRRRRRASPAGAGRITVSFQPAIP